MIKLRGSSKEASSKLDRIIEIEAAALRVVLTPTAVDQLNPSQFPHRIVQTFPFTRVQIPELAIEGVNGFDAVRASQFFGAEEMRGYGYLRHEATKARKQDLFLSPWQSWLNPVAPVGKAALLNELEVLWRRAVNALVECHCDTPLGALRAFGEHWPSMEDLYQEALLGLYSAVRRYDGESMNSFAAFASQCCYYAVRSSIGSTCYQISVPTNVAPEMSNGYETMIDFMPLRMQAAHLLRANSKELERRRANAGKASRVQPVLFGVQRGSLDSPPHIADVLEQANGEAVIVCGRATERAVSEVLASATERNAFIFVEYYVRESMTLEDLGRKLGLTRERIRQIASTIGTKVRKKLGRMEDHFADVIKPGLSRYNRLHERVLEASALGARFTGEAIEAKDVIADEIDVQLRCYRRLAKRRASKSRRHRGYVHPDIARLLGR